MQKLNVKKSLIAVSLVAFLALPVVASAGNSINEEATSVKVSFADLDIGNAQGVAVLYKRLQNASEDVCGPITYNGAGNLSQLSRNKACYQETLSKAVDKIDSEQLQALHNS